jgi:hypothetical protein
MRPTSVFTAFCALMAAAVLSGCGDPLSLLPAQIENREDTVTVWAATNTPLNLPSAYNIESRQRVRLDQVSSFDFIYDVDPAGRTVILPLASVVSAGSVSGLPGIQETATPFDDITIAEQLNYITKDTMVTDVGKVYYLRATLSGSCSLGVPYYAKMEVLAIDAPTRSMRFRVVTNVNCGYRGLELGLPKK